MPDTETLPPYTEDKGDVDSEQPQQVSQAAASTTQDDPDARIITLAHYDQSKPQGKKVIGQCSEAVLLTPSTTRQELMRLLGASTRKLAKPLKLGDEEGEARKCALMFVQGKGAEAQYVNVTDEENWQACRVLLRRHEDAKLIFYVHTNIPLDGTEGRKGGAADGGGEGARRSGKKCVVQ